MSDTARRVVRAFDLLPERDRQEIFAEMLRRALANGSAAREDADLAHTADQNFLELDRREERR
jgi:hypothetical protein